MDKVRFNRIAIDRFSIELMQKRACGLDSQFRAGHLEFVTSIAYVYGQSLFEMLEVLIHRTTQCSKAQRIIWIESYRSRERDDARIF